MDLDKAFSEVLKIANQPKKQPNEADMRVLSGKAMASRPIEVSGDAVDGLVDAQSVTWHESLTPAQSMVARWIWEHGGNCYQPSWEKFEFGFLQEFNTCHELAVWSMIACIYDVFMKRHPSENKNVVFGYLCALSMGKKTNFISANRRKEIDALWNNPADEMSCDMFLRRKVDPMVQKLIPQLWAKYQKDN